MAANNEVTFRIAAEDAYSQVMNACSQALKGLAADGSSAVDRLQKSFQTLNIKSQLDIENEKKKIVAAFDQIKNSGVATGNEIRRAHESMNSQLADLDGKLRGVAGSSGQAHVGVQQMTGSFFSLKDLLGPVVALLGAYSVIDIGKMAIENAIKMQALDVQFKTISGSSAAAAANLRFIREESDRLGLVFIDAADGFAKFAASAKGTALEGEGARKVFIGVSEAVTAMHLPAETSQRIFFQLQQMMSKNKVTAEDLNVVAESLPGTYTAVAKSLNLTVAEMRQQMESGKLLANEVLPKLAEQLHLTYGGAAEEGAKSAQAAMNRFKNEIVDTTAKIGQVLLPVLTGVINVVSGVAGSIKWMIDILGPGAPVAVAFAMAFSAIGLAVKFLTAEIIMNTAAMLVNPVFLLIAAGTAAVVAVAAAINQIAIAMGLVNDESERDRTAERLQKEEAVAAHKKKLLDDYEAAMGISLARQLAKEDEAYNKSVAAVNAKYNEEIIAANGNKDQITLIEKTQHEDIARLYTAHLEKRQALRDKDGEAQRKFYTETIQLGIAHAKAIGDLTPQEVNEERLKLAKKIEIVTKYYDRQIDLAKGNIVSILAAESAKNIEIEKLQQQHNKDYLFGGLTRREKELNIEKQAANAEIEVIKNKVANHVLSEQEGQDKILALKKKFAWDELAIATESLALTVQQFGKGSEEYKAALKVKEAATKAYYATDKEMAKNAEASLRAEYALDALAHKNLLNMELAQQTEYYAWQVQSLKDQQQSGIISHREYQAEIARLETEARWRRTVAEEEDAAATLRRNKKILEETNPVTQAIEYQKAVAATLAAEANYTAKVIGMANARRDYDAVTQRQITENCKAELEKRQQAEKEAAENFRAFVGSFYAMWDNLLNAGARTTKALSDAAYNAYARALNLPQLMTDSLEDVTKASDQASRSLSQMVITSQLTSAYVGGAMAPMFEGLDNIAIAAARVTAEFLEQKVQAVSLTDILGGMSLANLGVVDAAKRALAQMKLLDSATLDKLKGQIERLQGIIDSFRDSVKQTVAQIQDELDNLTMSAAQLEEKRYQAEMEKLKAQLAEAKQLQAAALTEQLRQAMENEQKIHDIKMANIRDEWQAQNPGAPLPAGYAGGGIIPGSGTGDTVPAMLTPGEFVVRAPAARGLGYAFLSALNEGLDTARAAISERITARNVNWRADTLAMIPISPRNFAMGGVVSTERGETTVIHQSIQFNLQRLDEGTVRREVLPVLEKLSRLKR